MGPGGELSGWWGKVPYFGGERKKGVGAISRENDSRHDVHFKEC
jgi:hypothetical protein